MKEDKDICIFCKILEGKSESSIVYEDELSIAIMDIQPVNPGHILVIPKEHIPYINDSHQNIGAHLFKIGIQINTALLKSNVRCEGVDYLLANGEAAGQEVFHAHLHIIPRFEKDGFGFKFHDKYHIRPERQELNNIASEIKTLLIKS